MPNPSPTSSNERKPGAEGASSTESEPSKRRRTFSAAYNLRIVQEADRCTARGEVEALLQREGLYSSHLATWRKQLRLNGSTGMAKRKRGRKRVFDDKDRRIQELEKQNAKLEREAHIAKVLVGKRSAFLPDAHDHCRKWSRSRKKRCGFPS